MHENFDIKLIGIKVGTLSLKVDDDSIAITINTKKLPLGLGRFHFKAYTNLNVDGFPINLVEEKNSQINSQEFSGAEDNYLTSFIKLLSVDWSQVQEHFGELLNNNKKYNYTVRNLGIKKLNRQNYWHLKLNYSEQEAKLWLSASQNRLYSCRIGSKIGLVELQVRNR